MNNSQIVKKWDLPTGVNQDRQHVITISPANMRRLEDVYGARTDRCKARIVNDILQRGLDEIEKAHGFA